MPGTTAATSEAASPGPLAGVKVLDLSIALTGPYAVALLADQGADVVKVERPGIGDIARWIGVSVEGMSAFYLACNRGKRCIAVDLGADEGREIVMALAADADVVVQNFRPGVIDRLDLGYEAVCGPRTPTSCTAPSPATDPRDRTATAVPTTHRSRPTPASPPTRPILTAGRPRSCTRTRPTRSAPSTPCQAITAALYAAGQRPRRAAPRAGHGRRLRVVPVGRISRQ